MEWPTMVPCRDLIRSCPPQGKQVQRRHCPIAIAVRHSSTNTNVASYVWIYICVRYVCVVCNSLSLPLSSFLLFSLRPFLAKGAFMYRFLAGTGETVITPVYLALLKRGVHFKFFHKVEQLHFNEERNALVSVDFQIQATLNPGIASYQPLIDYYLKDQHGNTLKPPLRVWPTHVRLHHRICL